jgi:hypothetical protein
MVNHQNFNRRHTRRQLQNLWRFAQRTKWPGLNRPKPAPWGTRPCAVGSTGKLARGVFTPRSGSLSESESAGSKPQLFFLKTPSTLFFNVKNEVNMHTIFDERAPRAMRPYQQPGINIVASYGIALEGQTVRDLNEGYLEMIFRVMPAYAITGVWIYLNCVRNVGTTIVAIRPELGTELATAAGSFPLSIDTRLIIREAPHLAVVYFGSFIDPAEALDVMRKIPIHAVRPHTLN